jgi:hypothetical protein
MVWLSGMPATAAVGQSVTHATGAAEARPVQTPVIPRRLKGSFLPWARLIQERAFGRGLAGREDFVFASKPGRPSSSATSCDAGSQGARECNAAEPHVARPATVAASILIAEGASVAYRSIRFRSTRTSSLAPSMLIAPATGWSKRSVTFSARNAEVEEPSKKHDHPATSGAGGPATGPCSGIV